MKREGQPALKSKKVLFATLIGSTIEFYDFFLYGTVASLVFNKLFFPSDDPFVSLLLAYASFGVTFFVRPLGGLIFSHMGDKFGRKNTLVISLVLMGIATVCIGLLPTYSTIGVLAPILLVTLRLVQGVALGGEWGGAVLLAVESAPKEKRGFFGSFPAMGIPLGMLLGTFSISLMSLLPEQQFLSWGWRIPFLLSALLVVVGLWIKADLVVLDKNLLEIPVTEINESKILLTLFEGKEVFRDPTFIDASYIKTLVGQFEKDGEFANHGAARSLQAHLDTVVRFEQQEAGESVVKHMQSFNQLLDNHKKVGLISEDAYDTLKTHTDFLIKKWQ